MSEEIKVEVKEEVKPKRSWVKRHKVALIITAIVLVIIIAPIAGFFGYINAWNTGMGLPEGFKYNGYPLTESTKYAGYLLIHQFKEENHQNVENKINFKYNEKIYRLQSGGSRFLDSKKEYNIFKENDETKNGTFFSQVDDDNIWNWGYDRILFFDEHYIYYIFCQAIKRDVYYTHDMEWVYSKYTFYRFDLDTGSNEEVKIELFVEKVNKYDETIKIK